MNEWHHVAATIDRVEGAKIYLNGVLEGTNSDTGGISGGGTNYPVWIGNNSQQTGRFWDGMIDDVQIYNRVLSQGELLAIMKGLAPKGIAINPVPADEATDLPRETVLSWEAGEYAATHNVYFGTAFEDVNTAGAGSPLLVSLGQSDTTYDPPGLLEYGQTYYWRVDEVNAAPDHTVFKGNVWSFTTEPLYYAVGNIVATVSVPTASGSGGPEVLVNGSGLTDGLHGIADATM
ncbi:MAG TPA: LamG domain-containing protein, partial [Phycisphaerales bacterium]|nr:LamG domain-containing protein [Phycisphaerales bacterium]